MNYNVENRNESETHVPEIHRQRLRPRWFSWSTCPCIVVRKELFWKLLMKIKMLLVEILDTMSIGRQSFDHFADTTTKFRGLQKQQLDDEETDLESQMRKRSYLWARPVSARQPNGILKSITGWKESKKLEFQNLECFLPELHFPRCSWELGRI